MKDDGKDEFVMAESIKGLKRTRYCGEFPEGSRRRGRDGLRLGAAAAGSWGS